MRRVALLTGGARRIGAFLAERLADYGFDLALHYRTSEHEAGLLSARLRQGGARVETFRSDLRVAGEVDRLVPEVYDRFGRLDLLINNASIFAYDTLESLSREAWEANLAVNYSAPIFLIRSYRAELERRDGTGLVVNMLDQKIHNANPDYFSYTGGKVGLGGMTRVLAMAMAPRIRVCGVAPNVTLPSGKQTREDFERAAAATPMGITTSTDDIWNAIRFVIDTPSVNGQIINIDAGEGLLGRVRDVAYDLEDG